MSSEHGSTTGESIIQFPSNADSLDTAGKGILSLLQQAVGVSEESNRRTREVAQKLAQQLRSADEQVKELEADVRYYKDRAQRAEQWLLHIATEIEKRFLASTDDRAGHAIGVQANSSPLAYAPRNQRRA